MLDTQFCLNSVTSSCSCVSSPLHQ